LAVDSGLNAGNPHDRLDHRIYKFSGGINNAVSLAQLSGWCSARLGPREIGSVMQPRAFDLPWVVLDSGRAARHWNWAPSTPLESILSEILG
jgi:CDP-paratose 2-epimerase